MTTPHRAGVLLAVAVTLGALWALPATGAAQIPKPQRQGGRVTAGYPAGPRPPRAGRLRPLSAAGRSTALATITETEPNDAPATATSVALGDVASGNIDPTGDVDYYAFDVTAGTYLILDVDASRSGSPLDPILWLYAPDGTTELAFSDDYNGLDSHIEYAISTTGRYYAAITDYYGSGGSGFFYSLQFTTRPTGPGDPTTLFATGLDGPLGSAAGPAGELYVTDYNSLRLLKVSPAGAVSTLAAFSNVVPIHAVLDGFGNLLVTVENQDFTSGAVYRVTLTGQVSTFATGLHVAAAITAGPDADVWVLDTGRQKLYRYSPFGVLQDSVDVAATGVDEVDAGLAFSPAGVLHMSNSNDRVYKIDGGAPQLVISGALYLEGIAFDRDGYLYVANGYLGTVQLYSPTYELVSDPFAGSNLGGPTSLVFGRDGTGAMTSRLLATNYGYNLQPPYVGSIVEMNPAGMRAPGSRIGIDAVDVAINAAADHLLGGAQVAPAAQHFLDVQGNNNGRYDVGDFRAYLRSKGQLPAAAGVAARRGGP